MKNHLILHFATTDNRILNTNEQYFEPTVTKNGDNTVVSMKIQSIRISVFRIPL